MGNTQNLILESLPLGSTIEEVERYLEQNFRGKRVKEHDLPDSKVKGAKGIRYICYRVMENGMYPAGSNWTEILFYFDSMGELTDVIVGSYGVWL